MRCSIRVLGRECDIASSVPRTEDLFPRRPYSSNILTISEAKGMEFDGVVLLDFLGSSPCGKEYEEFYSYMRKAVEKAVAAQNGKLRETVRRSVEALRAGGNTGGNGDAATTPPADKIFPLDGKNAGTNDRVVLSDSIAKFKSELAAAEALVEEVVDLQHAAVGGKKSVEVRPPRPPDRLFSNELKNLYVAQTRARRNFVLFEAEDSLPVRALADLGGPGHRVLCEARAMTSDIVPNDDEQGVSATIPLLRYVVQNDNDNHMLHTLLKGFTQKSSYADFIQRGEEYLERKLYLDAKTMFRAAGESRRAAQCEALHWVAEVGGFCFILFQVSYSLVTVGVSYSLVSEGRMLAKCVGGSCSRVVVHTVLQNRCAQRADVELQGGMSWEGGSKGRGREGRKVGQGTTAQHNRGRVDVVEFCTTV